MDKVYRYVFAALLAVAPALPASAMGMSAAVAEAPAGEGKAVSASQSLSGTVTAIDRTKSRLTLQVAERALELPFPAESLRELKEGETITAEIAIATAHTTAGSVRAYDAPSGLGQHQLSGRVESLDGSGWVNVAGDHESLQLHFSPQALRGLQKGDRVTVEMAFTRGS